MDLVQTARYFDNQPFDTYTPNANPTLPGHWNAKSFKGQMKLADKFISLYNLSYRRRMIYVDPKALEAIPHHFTMVRLSGSTEMYMPMSPKEDFWKGDKYRSLLSVQESKGHTQIYRQLSDEKTDLTLMAKTFGDYELRTAKSNLGTEFVVEASFYLYLPSGTQIKANDIVEFTDDGNRFVVLTPYYDSGLTMARAELLEAGDTDGSTVNITYTSLGDGVYDPTTQKVTYPNKVVFDVVVRAEVVNTGDNSTPVIEQTIKVLLAKEKTPAGFAPQIDDSIDVFGRRYLVSDYKLDVSGTEWTLRAKG